ncbi:MAG: FecR domain-containing protein [Panacibacter sp.]
MARSLGGEATVLEEEQLRILLSQDSSLLQQYELMKRMWHAGEKQYQSATDEEEKKSVSRILQLAKTETISKEEIPVVKIRSRRKSLYTVSSIVAAAIIVVVGLTYIYNSNKQNHKPGEEGNTQLVAENGSRTRTILPDGSTVWLNAGSHISFSENFTGSTREVTLNGEAYFDVVKQSERPFIVHVSGYDIRVLGTAFNVKSYATDKTVETTLLRGLVQVTKHGATKQKPIFLHPNEKLIVDKIAANDAEKLPYTNMPAANQAEKEYVITPLSTSIKEIERIETAWVYNRLVFHGDSFIQLAQKLERWYNIKIVFDDTDVEQLSFNGSFENETAEQALIALKTAAPFNYSVDGKEIHISKSTLRK